VATQSRPDAISLQDNHTACLLHSVSDTLPALSRDRPYTSQAHSIQPFFRRRWPCPLTITTLRLLFCAILRHQLRLACAMLLRRLASRRHDDAIFVRRNATDRKSKSNKFFMNNPPGTRAMDIGFGQVGGSVARENQPLSISWSFIRPARQSALRLARSSPWLRTRNPIFDCAEPTGLYANAISVGANQPSLPGSCALNTKTDASLKCRPRPSIANRTRHRLARSE